jgi:hypothetical protein
MKNENKKGSKNMLLPDVVVSIEKSGNRFNAWDNDGTKYTSEIGTSVRKNAYSGDYKLGRYSSKTTNSGYSWRRISDKVTSELTKLEVIESFTDSSIEVPIEHAEVLAFIHSSYKLKPRGLVMSELKWKYLIRSAVRGKNIMMTGPAGCGKTMAAKSLVNSLDRPDFYFNLGATQDPRSTLIGNTHAVDGGTYFDESYFVTAIRTPNAVILLDELSRAHPDAWNILMTVLDYGQRYLRLDEKDGSETVKVADGVTFVATANIGNEYTATRQIDRALHDRFTVVEMDVLNDEEEFGLLAYMFPNVDKKLLENISKIAHMTRIESKNENPRIENGMSTRTSVEMAGLLYDGFNLGEASEITIYPQYDNSGGVDSERTFVKQIVQKFVDDGTSDELFSDDEIEATSTS